MNVERPMSKWSRLTPMALIGLAACGSAPIPETPPPPVTALAPPPEDTNALDRKFWERTSLRDCAGQGLLHCDHTEPFLAADGFLVAAGAREIGVLGWSTMNGPSCTRFSRHRTSDLSPIMQSGCLGDSDPRHLSLAATPTGFLLATRAGYKHKPDGPYDIYVHRFLDGGAELSTPQKFATQEFVLRDSGGGGPIFTDARLIARKDGGPFLVFTSGAETRVALLDEAGKPVWGPKPLPSVGGPNDLQLPFLGGVAAVQNGFIVMRYAAAPNANGYNWDQSASGHLTQIDASGKMVTHALPGGPWRRGEQVIEGDTGPAIVISKGREHSLIRIDESGAPGPEVKFALPHLPKFEAGYAFAKETWIVVTDHGPRHASNERSKLSLHRVGMDGELLETRSLSQTIADINERAFLGVVGDKVWASWKSGGFFMRRMALALYEKPAQRAVIVAPEPPVMKTPAAPTQER